ncbi:unnamed protein product [Vitrella brassicaformis CCMP3155]|uniref:Uncharacterized protein n=1 Tax=Vitrella brassicaformis (strain CCMP3155) TaxID=1169540 RepID=A0A0G4GYP9_VITBC|nr:unnamed protein product [Vitrella brassicaformis CCMP3155]|eukprot:CEM36162.1 unnamed protein product [Vitrella brassicaformis CCMP3155]
MRYCKDMLEMLADNRLVLLKEVDRGGNAIVFKVNSLLVPGVFHAVKAIPRANFLGPDGLCSEAEILDKYRRLFALRPGANLCEIHTVHQHGMDRRRGSRRGPRERGRRAAYRTEGAAGAATTTQPPMSLQNVSVHPNVTIDSNAGYGCGRAIVQQRDTVLRSQHAHQEGSVGWCKKAPVPFVSDKFLRGPNSNPIKAYTLGAKDVAGYASASSPLAWQGWSPGGGSPPTRPPGGGFPPTRPPGVGSPPLHPNTTRKSHTRRNPRTVGVSVNSGTTQAQANGENFAPHTRLARQTDRQTGRQTRTTPANPYTPHATGMGVAGIMPLGSGAQHQQQQQGPVGGGGLGGGLSASECHILDTLTQTLTQLAAEQMESGSMDPGAKRAALQAKLMELANQSGLTLNTSQMDKMIQQAQNDDQTRWHGTARHGTHVYIYTYSNWGAGGVDGWEGGRGAFMDISTSWLTD